MKWNAIRFDVHNRPVLAPAAGGNMHGLACAKQPARLLGSRETFGGSDERIERRSQDFGRLVLEKALKRRVRKSHDPVLVLRDDGHRAVLDESVEVSATFLQRSLGLLLLGQIEQKSYRLPIRPAL